MIEYIQVVTEIFSDLKFLTALITVFLLYIFFLLKPTMQCRDVKNIYFSLLGHSQFKSTSNFYANF